MLFIDEYKTIERRSIAVYAILSVSRGVGLYLLPMFSKEELEALTNQYSDQQIAKKYGVSRSQIQSIRSQLGVQSFRSKVQNLTFELLDQLSDKHTDEQIAELLNMSASGVKKARDRLGVKAFAIKAAVVKGSEDFKRLDNLTENYSNIEIAKILGWTREYVNARCKELGVQSFTQKTGNIKTADGSIISTFEHNASIHLIPSNARRGKSQPEVRRYNFDERYFAEINSEDKAYFLGLLVADGCVYKNTASLSLTDSEPIYTFAKCLGASDETVNYRPNHGGGKDQWRIRLNSVAMVQDLLVLGITPCKSASVPYPIVAAYLERHLIRGIWDGDGHVGKKYAYVSGSEQCLTGIKNALQSRGLPTASKLYRDVGCYRLRLLKSKPQTMLWIYSDCKFYLQRKYDIAQQFWIDRQVGTRGTIIVSSSPSL